MKETSSLSLGLTAGLLLCMADPVVGGGAVELTMDNYESKMSGKISFVKFLAPWWVTVNP